MAQYKLVDTIDPNKIFLINRSELEGRFDSTSYKPSFYFSSSKYKMEKLKKVAYLNPKVTFDKLDKESEISFVPMEVVNEHNGKVIDARFKKIDEAKGFTRFAENDLIWAKITPCMQNGKSAVARNLQQGVGCGSTEFFVIRPKSENELLVDYLHFLLRDARVLKDAQNYFGGSAGQQRVSSEFIKDFKVPMLPIEMQRVIVELIGDSYTIKQQKESEAKALLESIDSYLLEELGIELPKQDNSLEKRIFTIKFSEITGIRIDPDYNSKYEFLISQKGNYEFTRLGDLMVRSPQYGANEEALVGDSDSDIRYIRITDIDEIGNLKENGWKTAKNTDNRYLLNYNDLLFARSGSVGKCYIHKEIQKPAIFAGYLIRFVLDSNIVNPDFIFYFCNSSIYYFWVSAIQRPAVQANINSEEYKSLPIPLPPIDKQTEIANHIQDIRSRAKALQQEAAQVLEAAKQEVERMMLGE